MRAIYGTAWAVLLAVSVVSIFTGTLNAATGVVLSMAALALVYVLALYSVTAATRETEVGRKVEN